MRDFTHLYELKESILGYIQSLPSTGLSSDTTKALVLLAGAVMELSEMESYIKSIEEYVKDINKKVVEANEIVKTLINDKNNSIG